MCLETPGAIGGVKSHVIGEFWQVDQDGGWVVEEPYDTAAEDVRWLLNFTTPLETIKEVAPDGGTSR